MARFRSGNIVNVIRLYGVSRVFISFLEQKLVRSRSGEQQHDETEQMTAILLKRRTLVRGNSKKLRYIKLQKSKAT